MKKVMVFPYDKAWVSEYERIKSELMPALKDCILGIEHVGSTAVEGLAAKPIIDIDVVIRNYDTFELVKSRLSALGYIHQGDLGIKDRQAFKYDDKPRLMAHHLYVCPAYSQELARHLAFRDYLRANKAERELYGKVKMLAARHCDGDIEAYTKAKDPWCKEILRKCDLYSPTL